MEVIYILQPNYYVPYLGSCSGCHKGGLTSHKNNCDFVYSQEFMHQLNWFYRPVQIHSATTQCIVDSIHVPLRDHPTLL